MTKSKSVGKKRTPAHRDVKIYFAIKSQNEIYYQLASVFKAATHDEELLTEKMVDSFLARKHPNFFLKNHF